MDKTDFLVIGSGIAGLLFALKAAERGTVGIVTKRGASDSNTSFAQGGIASVIDPRDSFDLHIEDTLRVGVGLCRKSVVEAVVREGPESIADLMRYGVEFSTDGPKLSLAREGGHSKNRIVHYRDLTGQEIQRILLERALSHPAIRMYENRMAVGLVTERHLRRRVSDRPRGVYGAYVLDVEKGAIDALRAKRTILATGGAGKVYIYTSNPDVATGDGIAMAYRAGARVANLEFVQFHPTWLYHPIVKSFLLTETLRGEGGTLRRADGYAFMKDYHPQGDLAARDVVARAIDHEMKTTGAKCVYLDMTHMARDALRSRFPFIYESCANAGIDMAVEPVPVVPATHYVCGGVDVDEWGRTSLANLFALGEVSHTGLHGANRLASNSLLEAVVFARRSARFVCEDDSLRKEPFEEPMPWDEKHADTPVEPVVLDHDWDECRRLMWDYVGIVRSDRRLDIALQRIQQLKKTVEDLYWRCRVTKDLLELRNIVLVGELIVRCALERKESRGLHYTESYPSRDDERFLRDTVLEKDGAV
jgi:L-aspartate oxidase